jgi:lipopolysaccharide/colanic/teichoic acid biosynthesis glycosyltransferase
LALAVITAVPLLLLERRLMATVRRRDTWINGDKERTLVYGYNEAGRLLMKKIMQAPEAGRELVGFVDDFVAEGAEVRFRVDRSGSHQLSVPLLGRGEDLGRVVRENGVTEVLISSPDFESHVFSRLSEIQDAPHLRWGIAAQLGTARPDELVVEDVGAVPVLQPVAPHPHLVYEAGKRCMDLILAGAGIILSAPLWLIIGIAIRLDSPGPVFFRQKRVGRFGKPFEMYKFRSLAVEAPPYLSAHRIPPNQITRVGRFLRTTALDELPQLLNVVLGHMSLVGPRPEMPFIAEAYTALERRRLTVRPGISGVWQMSADRGGMEIHENLEYDLFYVSNRSFTLDLVLLLETLVFALASLGRAVKRVAQPSVAEKLETGPPTPADTGRFILVALDQRQNADLTATWCETLRALSQEKWNIKVLSNEQNVSVYRREMDRLGYAERIGDRLRFVPYRGRETVHALLDDADLLITDLRYFAEMARTAGVDVLRIREFERERQYSAPAVPAAAAERRRSSPLPEGIPGGAQ